MSTAALLGPSSGFIWGFLPAVVISHALISAIRSLTSSSVLRTLGYFVALIIGCMIFLYSVGVSVQSVVTGMSWTALMTASLGFVTFDIIKAVIAIVVTLGIGFISSARKH